MWCAEGTTFPGVLFVAPPDSGGEAGRRFPALRFRSVSHKKATVPGMSVRVDAGRFDHDFWHGCWSGVRTPYLLRVDDHLAGFAIISRGSRLAPAPEVHDLAEFFVVRRYRRQGVGTRAAAELFGLHRGTWEVRQRAGNAAARAFWRKAIGAYTNERFDEVVVADERWQGWVQRFVS